MEQRLRHEPGRGHRQGVASQRRHSLRGPRTGSLLSSFYLSVIRPAQFRGTHDARPDRTTRIRALLGGVRSGSGVYGGDRTKQGMVGRMRGRLMAPYIPWKVRKAAEAARAAQPRQVWCTRYREARQAKREDAAFESGIEKLGEYLAAWTWLDEIPQPLWFPRCVSIECRPDQQIFMGMR